MENVVITGMGIISALGNGVKSNLQSLCDGKTGIGRMEYLKAAHSEFPVAEVKYSDQEMRRNMQLATEGSIPRTSILGIAAVREAISSAGIENRTSQAKFITGTTVGGIDVTEDIYFDLLTNKDLIGNIDYQAARKSTEIITHYTGLDFDKSVTISTACSSALNAIILGARLIRSGREKLVVAGGSESLSKFHFNGFRALHIADRNKCRPFDRTRAGLNLGEGGAYLVLESESDAKKRGAKILGYITGFSNACDAFHQTSTSPDGEGLYLAMKGALESAGLKPEEIDYINAHGTGTGDNDLSESRAIKRVFGEKYPPVSSTKGMTGHTTSAAGAVEAVICLLAMHNRFIPANIGFRNADDDGIVPSRGRTNVNLRHILCNSFGFGGNDSSIVISSEPTGSWKDMEKPEVEYITGEEIDEEERLRDVGNFVNPMQARRMGRIMKASVISTMNILEKSGIRHPDAVICCTKLGMLENGEQFIQDIKKNGEDNPKPALFMQSTYNTIASNIAILTGCHGYNITYAEEDVDAALEDAAMLIEEGMAETVLVGKHNETTDYYRQVMYRLDEIDRIDRGVRKRVSSQSYIVRKK